MQIKRVMNTGFTKNLSLLLLFVLLIGTLGSCKSKSLDDNKTSVNPIGTAIIGLSTNPGALFGNACSESVIQINTELVEDGTPIEFEITFSVDLPPDLRGCLFDASPAVFDGVAFVNYLAGVLIGIEELATVTISATINPPGGDTESDFITLILQGVGLIAPDNAEIVVPHELELLEDPPAEPVSLTLIFQSVGIKPGTLVELSVSRDDIGGFATGLDETASTISEIVQGTEESGEFVVQYVGFVGVGGTQVITARILLEIPPELAALCPMPPEEDLLLEATVVITQTVADPPMMEEEEDGGEMPMPTLPPM